MIRKPAVAGYFYPRDPIRLREMIERFLPPKAKKIKALGALCPHAGYMYSGPVAAATYSHIYIPEKVILIGPNHTGLGARASIMTEGSWLTPLGEVKIDASLASKILENSQSLQEDTQAHLAEHSLEVQIPFLQYFRPQVKIVPIAIMGISYDTAQDIGEAIAKAIASQEALVIASSDMTHYEPQDVAVEKDHKALEAILNLDPKGLYERVMAYNISMCGVMPAIAALTACIRLGCQKAQLIRYMTSGDVTGDYSQVVGYAGVIIY